MTIVDESKYVSGIEPGGRTTPGEEGDDHAVEPGCARPGRDERVHVGRAVAQRPPGGPVEAAARPRPG